MIRARSLSYSYPDGTHALRDVTIDVDDGEKLAIVGPNGAGKTTLLLALAGMLPISGKLSVDGVGLSRKTANDVRRRVGLVFQNPDDQLFCATVADDIGFGPRSAALPAGEVDGLVDHYLDMFDLTLVSGKPPFHLSLGQKRRASLACALAMEPEVLACDEPSSNLDPRSRRSLLSFLAGYNGTLLLSTHDLDMALAVTRRCIVLDAGRTVADGPTEAILTDADLLSEHSLELPLCLQGPPLPVQP